MQLTIRNGIFGSDSSSSSTGPSVTAYERTQLQPGTLLFPSQYFGHLCCCAEHASGANLQTLLTAPRFGVSGLPSKSPARTRSTIVDHVFLLDRHRILAHMRILSSREVLRNLRTMSYAQHIAISHASCKCVINLAGSPADGFRYGSTAPNTSEGTWERARTHCNSWDC